MRIEFKVEGGLAYFPGLSKPRVIDGSALSEAELAELRKLIDAAHFFQLPADSRAVAKGAADHQHYTITVEDMGRRHSIRLADPVANPALQALVDHLRRQTTPPSRDTPGAEDTGR